MSKRKSQKRRTSLSTSNISKTFFRLSRNRMSTSNSAKACRSQSSKRTSRKSCQRMTRKKVKKLEQRLERSCQVDQEHHGGKDARTRIFVHLERSHSTIRTSSATVKDIQAKFAWRMYANELL